MDNCIEWMFITASPAIASYAQDCGVHRILVDMEVLGKAERQGHLDTHKAHHSLDDVAAIRPVLTTSELMVRVNPLYAGSEGEVIGAIDRGADRVMLPMFTTSEQVVSFRDIVPANTPITYLAETPASVVRVKEWADLLHPGDEVHFGLNDLSLGLGLDFLFEVLAGGVLECATEHLNARGVRFGIGGVARPGGGELPANVVLGEHVRLGSCRAILSRAFHGSASTVRELKNTLDLTAELQELRGVEESWRAATRDELARNHAFLAERAFELGRRRRLGASN